MPKQGQLTVAALCAVALMASVANSQAAAKCTAYEQKVAKQIKDGKTFLKEDSFRKWIDDGLQTKAPYNKKPYTTYSKWYDQFDKLGTLNAEAENSKFFEKYGFTASAAYSVFQGYALKGKLTSSVDIDFEQKMIAFPCR